MDLIAAIDLLGGRARRLEQGDYERPLERSADPLALAGSFLDAGLRRLHVVDLDGAREGRPVNAALVGAICGLAAMRGARVQVGGGLREAAAVEATLAAGAHTAMLGSAAVRRPSFVAECVARWPGRIGLSLDLRAGRPAVDGWLEQASVDPLELAGELLAAGARPLAVTDVERDGTGAGPNLALLERFRRRFPDAILLAAGGISSPVDLAALRALGLDGAIVGRALLEGSMDIGQALASVGGVPAA